MNDNELAENDVQEEAGEAGSEVKNMVGRRRAGFPVTLVAIRGGELITGAGFDVHLQSVSGADYNFDDLGKCVSWIDRRLYNGEIVSEPVVKLLEVLKARRHAVHVDRNVRKLQRWLTELDMSNVRFASSGTAGFADLSERAEALPDHPAYAAYSEKTLQLGAGATLFVDPKKWHLASWMPAFDETPESKLAAMRAGRDYLLNLANEILEIRISITDALA